MEPDTKPRTKQILRLMLILTWVAFIGLMIKAGAILVSFAVSCFNPVAAKNLYEGLNLFALRESGIEYYTMAVSFMVAFELMRAFALFLMIKALSNVNLQNPFTIKVALLLEKISHVFLGIALITILNNICSGWIFKRTGVLLVKWSLDELVFLAGFGFIISQIFKRGVEIQSESDLTV